MPSRVSYYNQAAPFWDFVASLEEQGSNHPFFGAQNQQGEASNNEEQPRPNPWTEGWTGFPFGGAFPHRGPPGPNGRHHHGPPPPPPPPGNEKGPEHNPEEGPSEPREPPPPFSEEPPHHGPGPHPIRHHGPPHHGFGGRGRGRCGRGRDGFGGPSGRGGHPAFGPGGFGALADMFQSQLFGNGEENGDKTEDFKPEVDVFDTAETFVVHISLPGAKKEDVGVNWDSDKSELSIAGVIYRPGDEELLKKLALDERKVGAFERKVRLGSRANPAQVDVDGISAKLEDGILRVEVPKLDDGYVEIKKVDIQ